MLIIAESAGATPQSRVSAHPSAMRDWWEGAISRDDADSVDQLVFLTAIAFISSHPPADAPPIDEEILEPDVTYLQQHFRNNVDRRSQEGTDTSYYLRIADPKLKAWIGALGTSGGRAYAERRGAELISEHPELAANSILWMAYDDGSRMDYESPPQIDLEQVVALIRSSGNNRADIAELIETRDPSAPEESKGFILPAIVFLLVVGAGLAIFFATRKRQSG